MKLNALRTVLVVLAFFTAAPSLAAVTSDYQYDDQYRLTKVSRSDGTIIEYRYDEAGNRKRKIVTPPLAPTIISADNATFTTGVVGTFTVIATGNPSPNLSETGALPAGITFTSATGVLGGIPAAGTGGTYPIIFTAGNGVAPTASQNFTLTVNQAPAITSANVTTFPYGSTASFTVVATGFPVPTLSITSGALPSGLSFSDNHNGTATISGSSTSMGPWPLTITANNGIGTVATQNFTLTIAAPSVVATLSPAPPSPTRSTVASFTVGGTGIIAYRYQLDSGGYGSETPVTTHVTLGGLSDGGHNLCVLGKHTSGLWQVTPTTAFWTVDTTGPTLTLSTLPSGATTGASPLNIAGMVTDANGVASLTLNGAPVTVNQDAGFSFATTLAEGSNSITVVATDTAGNQTTESRTIIYDAAAPQLIIAEPADGSLTVTNTANVSGTVAATVTAVTVKVNGAEQAATLSTTGYDTVVTLAGGMNTIEVIAADLAVRTNSMKRTVFFDATKPGMAITTPFMDIKTNNNGLTVGGVVDPAPTDAVVRISTDGGDTFSTPTTVTGVGTHHITFDHLVMFPIEEYYPVVLQVRDSGDNLLGATQRNIIYATATLTAAPPTPRIVGTVLTFTAGVALGTGEHEYSFHLKKLGETAFTQVQAYSEANSWIWNTTGVAPGTYTIQVKTRPRGSTAAYAASTSLSYTLFGPVTSVNVTTNPNSPQAVGTHVTFTAAATGGSGAYQYQFWLRAPGGNWIKGQSYGSAASWVWNTAGLAAGTYAIQVWARNAGSSTAYEAYKQVSFTLKLPPAAAVAVTVTPASPTSSGAAITFNATASGGAGTYQYQFWLRDPGGAWTMGQSYGNTAHWTWNTTGLAPGTYAIQVWARNAGSTASYDAYEQVSYTLSPPASTVTLTAAPSSPRSTGTGVTFTAAATGGSGAYQYQFWLRTPGGTWVMSQSYGSTASWIWNTTGLVVGTYAIQVWARNAGSTAPYEAYKQMSYTLLSPVTAVSLSVAPPSPQPAGTTITFTAAASGESGIYQYQFWLRTPGGTWISGQPYGSATSWVWNTMGLAAGTYAIQVWARNSGSTASYEAYRQLSYTLGP